MVCGGWDVFMWVGGWVGGMFRAVYPLVYFSRRHAMI